DAGLRRLVDAHALVATGEVEWSLLTATAAQHHAGLVVVDRLGELRTWGTAVPDHVAAVEPDRRERVAAWLGRRRHGEAAAELVTTTRGLGPLTTLVR